MSLLIIDAKSSLKWIQLGVNGLSVVEKLLTFVRVFLQKAYNVGYTPAISMQPKSSSIQGQVCRIKETPNLPRKADL